jgi:signal transduction histidine kinase
VANAIKFTQNGGTVKVVYDTEEADDRVFLKITVQDDGIGMEKEQIEKFNNGQKIVGSAGTGGEESFGIGLQHVRKLVHELNGKILARSTPGEGTEFLVTVGMYNLQLY